MFPGGVLKALRTFRVPRGPMTELFGLGFRGWVLLQNFRGFSFRVKGVFVVPQFDLD